MFRTIFQWLVYSSVAPQSISLTLRAGIPLLVLFGIDSVFAEELADTTVQLIVKIGELAALIMTYYGFVRKVILSFVQR